MKMAKHPWTKPGSEMMKVTEKLYIFYNHQVLVLLDFEPVTGFSQVMESHGIYYFNFQAWKVMEFR